jgi:glucose-6-phosphate 1-dehydrogenase
MMPYQRLLGDAMEGDLMLFGREDAIEEAWRIVGPALCAGVPLYEYEPGSWGPAQTEEILKPPGGWYNPV